MAIRDPLFVQNAGPTGILDVEEVRVGIGALLAGNARVNAKSGFRPASTTALNAGAVTASGSPDKFVHIGTFQLFLATGRASFGGPYIGSVDAQVDLDLLTTHPADPTNPRNDLIIAQFSDTFYGDGTSKLDVIQVVGTPSGVPADPAPSGSSDWIPLARVRVNANATTITSGNITDLRASGHAKSLATLFTVGLGGVMPVQNGAKRDSLSAYPGQMVYRMDTKAIEIWDAGSTSWWSYDTQWQSYTPSWTGAITNPVIGNGGITARYFRTGKMCTLAIQIYMGSTTTFGSGTYAVSLPFTAASSGDSYEGGAYYRDASAGSVGHFSGSTFVLSGATSIAGLASGGSIIGSTVPFTWTSGDTLNLSCAYETV